MTQGLRYKYLTVIQTYRK